MGGRFKPPHGGVATACSVQRSVSTLLMPRCEAGLNDLLGAKEAGESETFAHLPKAGAGKPGRAPANFQPDVTEATVSVAGKLSTPITVSEAGQGNSRDV